MEGELRRSDKEIHDRSEIDDILLRASICHLGLNDRGECYVVPVNYGYDGRFLYIHSAPEGRKIDVLRADNRVSFTVCTDLIMKESDNACSFSMKYKSVMGRGLATLIDDHAAKEEALSVIMQHYAQGISTVTVHLLRQVHILGVYIKKEEGIKKLSDEKFLADFLKVFPAHKPSYHRRAIDPLFSRQERKHN